MSAAPPNLADEFLRRGDINEADAYLPWRRLRSRMQAEIPRVDSPAEGEIHGQKSSAAFRGAV